ncbi:IS3 family transposase, partial [Lentilactobacillus parakefiri]
KFNLADLLRVLPISPDTFFYWKRQFKKPDKDCQLKHFISRIWNHDQHMGVLRITQALLNDFDLKVNHKRVYRLMKELDIQGEGYRKKIRKYDSSKGPEGTRVKNKLRRR